MLSECSTSAAQEIGDGLDAPVRVPRKALAEVLRLVGAKVIHHEERVEVWHLVVTEHTAKVHARALAGRPTLVHT